jgi:hypothetical protein
MYRDLLEIWWEAMLHLWRYMWMKMNGSKEFGLSKKLWYPNNSSSLIWMGIAMIYPIQLPRYLGYVERVCYNGISGLLGITLSGYETFDEVEEEFFRLYKKEKGIELTRKPEYREGSFYKSINWGDQRIAGLSKGKFISLDQPGEPKEPRALRRDEYF